ncbi:SirB1 family protein [Altericista sp. CCNU0014]|uniref:SirB1 family protein n=1 Tax=Altericista sp. CCNU0014 TaxID=3082949 RepID=UPI003850F9A3
MQFSQTRQYLRQLDRDAPFCLAEAALYIALEEYPDLEIQPYLQRLDAMAEEVARQLPPDPYPLKILQTIDRYLFETLGFYGNERDYYDPRNSFLNEVLDRRTGIPITLSLVYLEIARRIGFPMTGINFPGHFLIRPDREDMELWVDPFHQGEILFPEDCKKRLETIYQQPVELRPEFFEPISPQQFLVRMLNNLKHIYLNRGDLHKCLAASEQILLVDPDAAMERRDRGVLYYQLGRWVEARQDLEDYLGKIPQAQDRPLIFQLLERITQNL